MAHKVSEGPESRRLFVNRHELIAEFLRRVHSPESNDVLFLYGEGGIGKSSLLDQFAGRYARRLETGPEQFLDPWINLSTLAPHDLVEGFTRLQSSPIRCARINFWEDPPEGDPRKAFTGLKAIHKRLKVSAPLFRAACVLYMQGTDGLTRRNKEWMEEQFPGDGADFAVGLLDQGLTSIAIAQLLHLAAHGLTAAGLPDFGAHGVKPGDIKVGMMALARGLWGLHAMLRGPMRAVEEARSKLGNKILDLGSYTPDDLLKALPRMLAEDINSFLDGNSEPVILLFDAHDRLIGDKQYLSPRGHNDPDAWLRTFLEHLRLDRRAVVVVAGQEPPLWRDKVPLDARAIDYLAVPDARLFLQNAAVGPEVRQEALIRYASIGPGQVQPLFLALLVDADRIEAERGAPLDPERLPEYSTVNEQQEAIIDRLLTAADTDLRKAIAYMAACRVFDWNSFHWLGEKLAFANFESRFEILTGLSCVRSAGERAFVMHSLLRRFLGGAKAGQRTHEACREYYSGPGHSPADAVYHEYFLNREAAARSWIGEFRTAVDQSEHEESGVLLTVRQELPVPFGVEFADEVGEYLARISRYDDAERELSVAVDYWADKTGGSDNGEEEYRGEWVGKGNALLRWAELRARRSDYAGAEEKYAAAVEAFDRALAQAPNYVGALNNKGLALKGWADLQARRGDHAGAEEKCAAAVKAYDRALALAPNYVGVLNNKGLALQRWADLCGDDVDPEEKYRAAVAVYDRALTLAPNHIEVPSNKGIVLRRWAELRALRNDRARAEEKYVAAVDACDRALALAPNYIEALNNKGAALQSWAVFRTSRGDYTSAEEKHGAAVKAYDRALALAPDYIEVLSSKGNVLREWAALRALQDDHIVAEEKYGAALEAYDRALALAPNSIRTVTERGMALQRWAELLGHRSDHTGAEEKYGAALEAFDRALALAPNHIEALNGKGIALYNWGLMKLVSGAFDSAAILLGRAGRSCAVALEISPHPDSYRIIARVTARLSVLAECTRRCGMLQKAVEFCDDWQRRFPWDIERVAVTRSLITEQKRRLNCP